MVDKIMSSNICTSIIVVLLLRYNYLTHVTRLFVSLQNDISDVLDLTFSVDADEEKLILYERTEVTVLVLNDWPDVRRMLHILLRFGYLVPIGD